MSFIRKLRDLKGKQLPDLKKKFSEFSQKQGGKIKSYLQLKLEEVKSYLQPKLEKVRVAKLGGARENFCSTVATKHS